MPLDTRPARRPDPQPTLRVDVEPLTESRWAKIEAAIFEQIEHDPRVATPHFVDTPQPGRWRAGAGFVVAGAVAAAIGALVTRAVWHPEPPPAITSQVETGSSGTHLVIGEAALDVGPDAALLVNGDDARGVLVVLERGRVEFEVAPRRGRPPFVVQAGEARVRVTGTHFAVDRTDEGPQVDVASGAVEVSTPSEIVNVRAGEHWPAEDRAVSAVSPEVPTSDRPRTETSGDTLRTSRRGTNSPRPQDVAPSDFVSSGRAASEAPVPAAPSEASGEPPPPSTSPAQPEAVSRRALFESAARLESSRPAAALSQYGELARGTDPWAANALYAAGRLQMDRGMHEQARRTLGAYLERFPTGANAGDARDLLSRLKGKTRVP